MGAIHYDFRPVTFDELARSSLVLLVRRADPMTRVAELPPLPPGPPGMPPIPDDRWPIHYDRLVVVEAMKGETPALLEVPSADNFVQRSLHRNPYSHPIQPAYRVAGVGDPGPLDAEFIVFVDGEPGAWQYAWGGLRLPVSARPEILAALERAKPPPPPPGFWTRVRGWLRRT